MFSDMTVRTDSDSVIGVENLVQERFDGNDVVNFQIARSSFLGSRRSAAFATEPSSIQHVRAEVVVDGRVMDHEANLLHAALPIGVPMPRVHLPLELSVASDATGDTVVGLRREIKPFLRADFARERDLLFPLRRMDARRGAVRRDLGLLWPIEVERQNLHRLAANSAGMFPRVFGGPLSSLSPRLPIASHTTPDYTRSPGLVRVSGELRETYSESHGNPQPSRRYTAGRFRDYRRGLAPLITGKSARHESEEIVQARGKLRGTYVEDIEEVQSRVDLRSKYTDKAGYSLMAFIEGDATSGLMSLPANFSQLRGTLGSEPTVDTLIDAKSDLDRADAPQNDRFILFSPGFHNSLLKITQLVSGDFVSGGAASATQNGQLVGKYYGAPVYSSTLTANSPNVSGQAYGFFCHKRGIALVMQRAPRVHDQYVLLETGWGVLVDVIYNFAERLIAPKTLGGGTSDDKFNVGLRGPA